MRYNSNQPKPNEHVNYSSTKQTFSYPLIEINKSSSMIENLTPMSLYVKNSKLRKKKIDIVT